MCVVLVLPPFQSGPHIQLRMCDMSYVNNAALPRPILTFVFQLISPTEAARSEQDKYHGRDKEPLCNAVHDFCLQTYTRASYSDDSKGTKIVVNAVAVWKGKSQTKENGIIRCAFVLSNFSMWAKLLNRSVVKL